MAENDAQGLNVYDKRRREVNRYFPADSRPIYAL